MKNWTDAINNSSSGVKMFYGKATSTGYTDFQIGFYPRIIMYQFIWNDDPASFSAYGITYNNKLNVDRYMYATRTDFTGWFGMLLFMESSVRIKVADSSVPVYFSVFG